MQAEWITDDVDNHDLVPLNEDGTEMFPWREKRINTLFDYEFKNIGYAVPKGYVIVEAKTPADVKFLDSVNNKLGIYPPKHNTGNGSHYIYRLRKNPKIFYENLGASDDGELTVKGLRVIGNGNGYIALKKDNIWEYNQVELAESIDKAPPLPYFLMIPPQNTIKLSDYIEGQRDEIVYKKWIPWLRLGKITQTFFIKFMVEVALIREDKESIASTKLWAKKKWEISEKNGEIKPENKSHSDEEKEKKNYYRGDITEFLKYDKNHETIIAVADHRGAYDYITEKLNMYYTKEENQIWIKNESGFFEVEEHPQISVGRLLIEESANAPQKIINELNSGLSHGLERKKTFDNKYAVLFLNKNINIRTGDEFELGEEFIPTNQIPWNLIDETAYKSKEYEVAKKFVKKLFNSLTSNNNQVKRELLELIGATMIKVSFDKAWFLYGTASNGKSLFIRLLQNILGSHNYSAIDLKDIVNNKFSSAGLYGKLANLVTDMSDAFISETSLFKRLSSGERISAERKGEHPFEFDNNATLVFGTNQLPMLKEEGVSAGVERRVKIIPFLNYFNDAVEGEYVKDMIGETKVVECIIFLSIKAIIRCWRDEHGVLYESEISKKHLENYIRELNHIFIFLKQHNLKNGDILTNIYSKYTSFISKYNFYPFNYSNFKNKLKKAFLTSSNMEMLITEEVKDNGSVVEKIAFAHVSE